MGVYDQLYEFKINTFENNFVNSNLIKKINIKVNVSKIELKLLKQDAYYYIYKNLPIFKIILIQLLITYL